MHIHFELAAILLKPNAEAAKAFAAIPFISTLCVFKLIPPFIYKSIIPKKTGIFKYSQKHALACQISEYNNTVTSKIQ